MTPVYVFAEHISGSEAAFAQLMTQRAHQLGLKSANFVNSSGLPGEGHVISAYDLAQLARITIAAHPEFLSLYTEPDFTWTGIKQYNRNPLLGAIDGADGLKTGYTEAGGYGLVGSAIQNGKRRIIVVNGLESSKKRRSVSRSMMISAMRNFDVKTIRKKGDKLGEAAVYLGKSETVDMILPQDVKIGYAIHDAASVSVKLHHPKEIAAPITAGQTIGELVVEVAGAAPKTYPVLASETIEAKSGISKALAILAQKF